MFFKPAAAMGDFVNKGWTGSGGATADAGAAGKTVGGGSNTMDSLDRFTLSTNGIETGVAIEGSKFWKPDDLH